MPCAIPPVDQSASQLGWGDGYFYPANEPGRARQAPVPHRGLDFMADAGSPVVAPWDGVVVAVGEQPYGRTIVTGADALGHYVVISHGEIVPRMGSVATRYAHLRAPSALRVGQRVHRGDLVGYVGVSGRAPERRDRPLLFFQALRERSGANWSSPHTGLPVNALEDFFAPLGVMREGATDPSPPVAPYEQVPVWGGQLVQQTSCEGGGTRGLGSIDPRVQRPLYARYGTTQLSSRAHYAPARYDAASSDSAGGSTLVVGIGLVAGMWYLLRPKAARQAPPWWVRQRRWARG